MTAIMLEIRPVEPGDGAEWLRLRLALWPNASPAAQATEIAALFICLGKSPPLFSQRLEPAGLSRRAILHISASF
jgi:hypothetical protein